MGLSNKKIFIISPQKWESIKISKHHYAQALSNQGAMVYFINPINFDFAFKTNIQNINKNLTIVSLTIPIPKIVKFRLKSLFNNISTLFFKYLINKVGSPDILWNFDNELYFKHEKLFYKSLRLFHPVDMFSPEKRRNYMDLYDFVFSPSIAVLNNIKHNNKYFINHGLNQDFVNFSRIEKDRDVLLLKSVKTIGYMGNISIPVLNRKAFISIITNFPKITFNLIGEMNDQCEFQHSLVTYQNVVFIGRKEGESLYNELLSCDILLVCYSFTNNIFHNDNTHKLLEYLSTGKPIISSPIKAYEDYHELISFIDFENDDYISKIDNIINNYSIYNSDEKRKQRMELAISNSYQKQIERIENIIND